MENRESQGIFRRIERFYRGATDGLANLQRGLGRNRQSRKLRLSETLSLGEKRFVAVIEFQRQQFLIGGTASSIVLLTRLPEEVPSAQWKSEVEASPFKPV